MYVQSDEKSLALRRHLAYDAERKEWDGNTYDSVPKYCDVFAIYQIILGWKTYKYYHETDELPPTQVQPNPRKDRLKVALGHFFPQQTFFRGLGDWFYIGNKVQETPQPNQILRKHPDDSFDWMLILKRALYLGTDRYWGAPEPCQGGDCCFWAKTLDTWDRYRSDRLRSI